MFESGLEEAQTPVSGDKGQGDRSTNSPDRNFVDSETVSVPRNTKRSANSFPGRTLDTISKVNIWKISLCCSSATFLGRVRAEVGYWAIHERGTVAINEVLDAPWNQLTEDEGWRLPKELIPSLALLSADTCPTFPLTFETNWTSYYQWRGLPISSPAALLLHWPLTVYECLKSLASAQRMPGDSRRKLTVFYVGAREEVCYIPVFGELALLLPNTELDLVFSGENTGRAVRRPKALNHGTATNPGPCVFQYTAPTSCGSTVRVFIDSNPSYYCPSRKRQEHPDAIVALNAGLGTYISWQHVILLSSEFDIPFVVTDYNEVCTMEMHAEALQQALTSTFPVPKNAEQVHIQKVLKKVVEEVKVVDVEKVCRALKRERPGKLNGFMQPGDRHNEIAPLVAAARNAWIQVITPVAKEVESEGVGA
ncbi:hypothetical protein DFH06DRAFT_149121 [Mycena polygramma]|nr:hypothetical protein DFH06DRAFT_149121 [Mycena polygramma]